MSCCNFITIYNNIYYILYVHTHEVITDVNFENSPSPTVAVIWRTRALLYKLHFLRGLTRKTFEMTFNYK